MPQSFGGNLCSSHPVQYTLQNVNQIQSGERCVPLVDMIFSGGNYQLVLLAFAASLNHFAFPVSPKQSNLRADLNSTKQILPPISMLTRSMQQN